jgi:hypothetical protein
MCDESLLCVRMITIFKELFAVKTAPKSAYTKSGRNSMGDIILHSLSFSLGPFVSFGDPQYSNKIADGIPKRKSSTIHEGISTPTPATATPVDKMQIITKAWEIYSYFIACGAIFEISLLPRQRISIMRQLGNPKADMFDQLLSMAMRDLNFSFQKYKETENYRSMNKRSLRNAVMIQSVEKGTGGSIFMRVRRALRKKVGKIHAMNT